MTTLSIEVYAPADKMPPIDTDVLIFLEGKLVGELGAYLGPDEGWVDADGLLLSFYEPSTSVVAWCEMPCLPAAVKLNPRAAWPFPVEAEARN